MWTVWLVLPFVAVLAQDECGQKPEQPPWEPLITDGRDATEGYWPWQLSLQFLRTPGGDDFRHTCGAALIREDWAITAAHCVDPQVGGDGRDDPERFRLIAGGHNLTSFTGVEQILYTDMIILHERWIYDPTIGFPNDIAVIRLREPADLSADNVGTACMPTQHDFNFTDNADCWITGWGKTSWLDDWIPDILQEGSVKVPSNDICMELNPGFIRDSHICGGEGTPGACSGDSGGPVNCFVDGQWYVAGLASWTIVFCQGVPPVYTRVSKFWEWVDYNIDINPHP